MTHWLRFSYQGQTRFGKLANDTISVCEGDMFAAPKETGETVDLDSVKVLTPTEPTKMLALWNNFHAMAKKFDFSIPEEPLYLLKASNSFLGTGEAIRTPRSYDGRVVFEGELGIVIGKTCKEADEKTPNDCIFGYTCINDVTAFDLINKDPSFPQWTRAKSFDTFGVFGPVVATDLDPDGLVIRTLRDGEERQNYPASDMIIKPARIVGLISQDMTLCPGDVICCGTSLGAGSLRPGNTIEVVIDGIGTLSNTFE